MIPLWPLLGLQGSLGDLTEQQGDGLAGYQQYICDFRSLKNECCLNVAQKVKLLYIPLQRMLSNVPMDATEMSS